MIESKKGLIFIATKILGIIFIIIGIVWSIFESYLCEFLCDVCTKKQLSPCSLLFLFVGIILVVVGFSLVKLPLINLPQMELKGKAK